MLIIRALIQSNWHIRRQTSATILISAMAAGLVGCGPSFELITPSEYSEIAGLPDSKEILRAPPPPNAPKITVHKPDGLKVQTPFDIDIRFQPSADATIVPDTARVVYVKGIFRKDLTDLIRQHAKMDENGIYGKKAAIPPGKHRLLVEVSDDEGRLGEAEFKIHVVD